MEAISKMDEKLENISRGQQSMKDSVENKLNKLSEQIGDECKKVTENLMIEITQVKDQVMNIDKKVYDMDKSLNDDIIGLRARLERVEETASDREPEFNTERTIVVCGIRYSEDENVMEKARIFVHNGLCLNLDLVNAMRTPMRESRPGILKIEFANKEDKIEALKQKRQLKDHPSYRNTYARSSQSHLERIKSINTIILIRELGLDEKWRIAGNGKLVTKDNNNGEPRADDNEQEGRGRGANRSARGLGRGRGRGRGGQG